MKESLGDIKARLLNRKYKNENNIGMLIFSTAYPRTILIYAFSSLCILITFVFVAASMICPANVEAFFNVSSLR